MQTSKNFYQVVIMPESKWKFVITQTFIYKSLVMNAFLRVA